MPAASGAATAGCCHCSWAAAAAAAQRLPQLCVHLACHCWLRMAATAAAQCLPRLCAHLWLLHKALHLTILINHNHTCSNTQQIHRQANTAECRVLYGGVLWLGTPQHRLYCDLL